MERLGRRSVAADRPGQDPSAIATVAPPVPQTPSSVDPLASSVGLLAAVAEDGPDGASFDGEQAVAAIDALARAGRRAEAVALVPPAAFVPSAPTLRGLRPWRAIAVRLAEFASDGGDDERALAYLRAVEPSSDRGAPPAATTNVDRQVLCRAFMLRGAIHERRGDREGARRSYERVLTVDVNHPQAWARARRMAGDPGSSPVGEGATLVVDGALTAGRYRVEAELGRGGAGTVFRARDLALGRRIALKVYHRRDPSSRARLVHEGRVAAGFEHPAVIRIFDVEPELSAIAMEWIAGGSLRAVLDAGSAPWARACRWLLSAADALAVVHRAGFAHRDIKPSNLLLRSDDTVALTDFGLAASIGQPAETGPGEGSLKYMPEEQRRGAVVHPAADIHALGVTMAEVMAATAPPDEAVGRRVQAWIARCTAESPDARPDLGALRAELGIWSRGRRPVACR